MADILNGELQAGKFVSDDAADGALLVILAGGALASLIAWNDETGDVLHGAPAGSNVGGGTRRHLFDREIYVDSNGAGLYLNVRDWASLTNKPATFPPSAHSHTFAALQLADGAWPTTLAGYGITNGISTAGGQTIAGALTLQGALNSRDLVPTTSAAYDVGTATFKYRDGNFSRNVTIGSGLDVTANSVLRGTTFFNGILDLGIAASGSGAASDLIVYTAAGNAVRTNVNDRATLGVASVRWSNVYSVLGNFSAAVTIGGTLAVANTSTFAEAMTISPSGHGALTLVRPDGSKNLQVNFYNTVATHLWAAGVQGGGTAYAIYNGQLTTNALSIASATNAATFAASITSQSGDITVQGAGGGFKKTGAGTLEIDSASSQSIALRPGGTAIVSVTSTGVLASTDAAYDWGGPSNRFRDGYFSRNLVAGGTITAGGRITSNPSGDVTFVGNTSSVQIAQFNSTSVNGGYIEIQKSGTTKTYLGSWLDLIGSGSSNDSALAASGQLGFAANGAGIVGSFNATNAFIAANATTEHTLLSTGGAGVYATAVRQAGTTSTSHVLKVIADGASGTTAYLISGYNNFSVQSFAVFTNGNVQNTNNSYGAISDLKLKTKIREASPQWDDVLALSGLVRVFQLKSDIAAGTPHDLIGGIAQEWEKIAPGLVEWMQDYDSETGKPIEGSRTGSIKYSLLPLKMLPALGENMRRTVALENRIAELETTVISLRERIDRV